MQKAEKRERKKAPGFDKVHKKRQTWTNSCLTHSFRTGRMVLRRTLAEDFIVRGILQVILQCCMLLLRVPALSLSLARPFARETSAFSYLIAILH